MSQSDKRKNYFGTWPRFIILTINGNFAFKLPWQQDTIEYQNDDFIKKKKNQHFHDFFLLHISVEHYEKPPHTKFGGNRFMVAQDMAA